MFCGDSTLGGMVCIRESLCSSLRRLAATAAVGGLIWASPAGAEPTWRVPQTLSEVGKEAHSPQVVVGPTGNTTVVWAGAGGPFTLKAVTKAGDALAWGAIQDASVPGQDIAMPRLALDASGNVLAVYRRSNGTNTVIQSALRPAGVDGWSNPQTASAPLQNAINPDVAFDGAGNATAVWVRLDGANFVVQTASRVTNWSAAQDLSAPGRDARNPRVAVDAAGNAIAVWERPDDANLLQIQVTERSASTGQWAAPHTLSTPGRHAVEPSVVVDAAGSATAVWREVEALGSTIQASSWSLATGTWSAPRPVSAAGGQPDQVRTVTDPAGNVTVVWRNSGLAGSTIQSATMAPNGTWSAPVDLSSPAGVASQPDVATNSAGTLAIVWRTVGTVQAVVRRPGESWPVARDISVANPTVDEPRVALDAAGNGVAVWVASDGFGPQIHAAGLDATGPVILGVVVPPEAFTGERLEMFAAAFDVWSGPATLLAWQFGDGRTGSGDQVRRIYRKTGRYTVTVTSSDTLGGTTTVTRSLVVRPMAIKALKATCPEAGEPGVCRPLLRFVLTNDATVRMTVRDASGKALGTVRRTLVAGPNDVELPGKVGRTVLVAGRYQISVRAFAGGAVSATRKTRVSLR